MASKQRRAQDRERLKRAAEQLLTSDGWQRWVHVRSRAGVAEQSLSNPLLSSARRDSLVEQRRQRERRRGDDQPEGGREAAAGHSSQPKLIELQLGSSRS